MKVFSKYFFEKLLNKSEYLYFQVEDTGLLDEPARPARPAILDEDPPKTMSESVEIVYDDCTVESVHQSAS